jgi:hypothetical protein
MIEKIAKGIVKAQIEKPFVFLWVFGIVTLLLVPGIFNLVGNVEPSLEKILPQDIEEVKTMNDMRAQFGADMAYLLVYADGSIGDVRDPVFLNYIDSLEQKILTYDVILQTQSLVTEVKVLNGGVIPNSIDVVKSLNTSQRLVNQDYSLAIIQIKSDTGSSASRIKYLVEALEGDIASLDNVNPGARVEITGFNTIDKATFEVIMSDFGFITLISMALVMIVVFLTFRSVVRGSFPMVVVMTALVWTMGFAGYLNLTITVVSMVAAAMIMGLGIDFGIHMVHTYFENRKKHNSEEALEETMTELLRAMLGASLTTTAGFLALLFGVLPAMKTLAVILAMGILNTLLGAIFLLPVIVYLYDKKRR